ncbi:hypothetical protein AYI69_g4308 [Smittium culicis]|uniref:Uncharacterized protein n=1 Tax=Smittium culicis TaxID=133412 RepID=A0A1R1YER9_9FUNG|nr:hypothetical protein AYI69_g4308 [Smittium culicis]
MLFLPFFLSQKYSTHYKDSIFLIFIKVKELTDKVKELLRENYRNIELGDPYFTTIIPLTDLVVYPELIEALTSSEEDFIRTPLTEYERKEAIHSCPQSSSMIYLPPPLNDSVSAAVKKQTQTCRKSMSP